MLRANIFHIYIGDKGERRASLQFYFPVHKYHVSIKGHQLVGDMLNIWKMDILATNFCSMIAVLAIF